MYKNGCKIKRAAACRFIAVTIACVLKRWGGLRKIAINISISIMTKAIRLRVSPLEKEIP